MSIPPPHELHNCVLFLSTNLRPWCLWRNCL